MTAMPDAGDFVALAGELGLLALFAIAVRRLVARSAPVPREERGIAAAVVALALAAVAVQALGFAGALSAPALTGVLVALVLVALAVTRGRPEATSARTSEAASPGRGTLVVAAASALAAAPLLARALLSVPIEWDGLTYHLFYATTWLQQRSLAPVPFGQPHDLSALYPGNGEALEALLMAFVRSDLPVAAGMLGIAALFGWAVARLARAEGASRGAAVAAGALAATAPALASRAASSYVEPLLDFGLVAAVLFARRALAEPQRALAPAALAGLATGLAAGTKYPALPLAALLALALAAGLPLAGASVRRALGALALYLGGAVAAGGAWYLRNFLLTGNPFYPTPVAGLPHLARAGLEWQGASVAGHLGELAASGRLADALFGLPPARLPAMTLGPLAVAAVALALAGAVASVAAARAHFRAGERAAAVARLLVPAALATLAATWLRLPFWDNEGLLRSEVRFAVPAGALAWALALATLSRFGVRERPLAVLGAAGVLFQAWLAGVADGVSPLARGAALLAVPLAVTLLCGLLAVSRRRTLLVRVASGALALFAAAVALFAAWGYREARREAAWLAPGNVFLPFAEAALAAERAHPGPARVVWATSSHNEFLALFTGRRLERRVLAVPVHPGPLGAFRYADGDPRRSFDAAFWRARLDEARADLLVVSRWRAWHELWPPEDEWARQAGFPLAADYPDFRVYEIPAAPAQGSRGANQPDSQPRAR